MCPANDYQVAPIHGELPDANPGRIVTQVTAPGACPWVTKSPFPEDVEVEHEGGVAWGSMEVNVDVLRNNPSPTPVLYWVWVADQQVLAMQQGNTGLSCADRFDWNADHLEFQASDTAKTFTLTTSQAGCGWKAVVSRPWLHLIGPTSGVTNASGTMSLTMSADRNDSGSERFAQVTVNGVEITVQQDTDGCSFDVNPLLFSNLPSSEADPTMNIYVTAPNGCGWSAENLSSFLQIYETVYNNNASSGSGYVKVYVENNPQATFRTGTILVAGQLVVFHQLGVGGLPEPSNGSIFYYHTDAIGSVRLITNASGNQVARYDYLPTGQQYSGVSEAPWNNVRFGGKERDAETSGGGFQPLNYFGARFYQSQTGRFTSVDPVTPMNDGLFDPQRWNRYAYALNNPLRYLDPDGRYVTSCVEPNNAKECANSAERFDDARLVALRSSDPAVVLAAAAYGVRNFDMDVVTGSLVLTFTDLVLPGNVGRELRFQRTYNIRKESGRSGSRVFRC